MKLFFKRLKYKAAILKKITLIFFRRFFIKNQQNEFKEIFFKKNNRHIFFGYYDNNPFSSDNKKILAISVDKNANVKGKALVGFFDIDDKTFTEVGITDTWCWQQGCRLKWSPNQSDVIIYNKLVNEEYGCVFQNIHSKEIIKEINFPIYDITSDELHGLSLNFSRLQRLRPGYGYDINSDNTIKDKVGRNTGIYLIDIKNNASKLIVNLESISQISPKPSMDGAEHYFNHLSWNPSGNRFLFFHLWKNKNLRQSRLFTVDKNGENLYLLENEEIVSHYSWINDIDMIITTYSKEFGARYNIYKDQSKQRNILSVKELNEDGHPSFCSYNNNLFLSDTYPNKYGDRSLFTYNIQNNKKTILGDYYSPVKYRGEHRCDLHPRWNNDGSMICFDSTHHNNIRTINIICL